MLVGSLLSSTVPDRYIRPVIAFVIFASGLKYVGLDTTALGWILCGTLLAAATVWLVYTRPFNRMAAEESVGSIAPEEPPEPDALLVGEQRS